jgi:hypothetical protein
MTRWLIALLLLLNGAMLAWQWGAFAPWGWAPSSAREPERVQKQIRPEALTIETPEAAAQRLAAEKSPADSAAWDPVNLPGPPAPSSAANAAPAASVAPVAPAGGKLP